MRNKYWWGLLLFFFCGIVLAQSSPMDMLQTTSNQMLSALNANKATLKTNRALVYRIVNTILVPHVDLNSMSRSVLGRNAWIKATPDQRVRFTRAFTTLLIHTYSGALASYTNETINFYPVRGGIRSDRVQVQSMIIRQNGPSIPVSYRVVRQGSEWKIYDFSVEGVSILESFRSQFANDLAGNSLDNLIANIERHNAGNE